MREREGGRERQWRRFRREADDQYCSVLALHLPHRLPFALIASPSTFIARRGKRTAERTRGTHLGRENVLATGSRRSGRSRSSHSIRELKLRKRERDEEEKVGTDHGAAPSWGERQSGSRARKDGSTGAHQVPPLPPRSLTFPS